MLITETPTTEKEWLEVFPEGRRLLLRRYKQELKFYKYLINYLEYEKQRIQIEWDKSYSDQRWIYSYIIETIDQKLEETATKIKSSYFQLSSISGRQIYRPNNSSQVTESDIAQSKLVPISTFISGKLRKVGNKLSTKCPFHEDRSPSFVIYLKENRYHCFGCGEHGDIIDFMMKQNNIGFIEAVKYILK